MRQPGLSLLACLSCIAGISQAWLHGGGYQQHERGPLGNKVKTVSLAHQGAVSIDAKAFGEDLASHEEGTHEVPSFPLEGFPWWEKLQREHADTMQTLMRRREHLDLVIFGDSITELMQGTGQGSPYEKASEIPAVFRKYFAHWRAIPLGISGDRTMNLMWRISEGGEAPYGLQVKHSILQIGTNNLYNHYMQLYGAAPLSETRLVSDGIVHGIIAVAEKLLGQWPDTHVWILGLLPRGNVDKSNPAVYDTSWPSMFTEVITEINRRLQAATQLTRQLSFMDCGHALLTSDQDQIEPELTIDGLHPSALGMEKLLVCLKHNLPPIQRLHTHNLY